MKKNDLNNSENFKELKKYGRILNEELELDRLDPVIGRNQEIRRIVEILSRKKKNNPVLVGDAGVGKTAIVEGLTQRIEAEDVPINLKNKKIFELNIASLISGAKFHGEFEQRLKMVTDLIKENNDILLFIDELHLIVGAGKTQGAIDASNILKPMLARGELRCIGATTSDEYRKFIEKDAALERRFQKIMVFEPSVEETITILRGLKGSFESFHEIMIKDNALIAAANLSNQYLTLRNLPDKAIDLVDEACAKIKTEIWSVPLELDQVNRKLIQLTIENNALEKEEEKDFDTQERFSNVQKNLESVKKAQKILMIRWNKEKEHLKEITNLKKQLLQINKELNLTMQQGNYERSGELKYKIIPELDNNLKKLKSKDFPKEHSLLKNYVDEDDIAQILAITTKIPVEKLIGSEQKKIINLLINLKKEVKGQDEALKAVTDSVVSSRTGLNDPNQPLASFLFVGPTGVGKTLIAKVLAETLFASKKKMIRFDMSEYNTEQSVSRLIGASPGYVGFERGGELTEKVKNNPYSVLLFDELEKAHQSIHALLLQILDEGQLKDSFSGKTINFCNTIVIMTSNIGGELLEMDKYDEKNVLKKVQSSFPNEFFNRIGEVIVFNPLNQLVLSQIVDLELTEFFHFIQKKQNIFFQYDKKAKNKILNDNYTSNYGARPIKRYIKKYIVSLIAQKIIKEEIKKNTIYLLTIEGEGFKITKPIMN